MDHGLIQPNVPWHRGRWIDPLIHEPTWYPSLYTMGYIVGSWFDGSIQPNGPWGPRNDGLIHQSMNQQCTPWYTIIGSYVGLV